MSFWAACATGLSAFGLALRWLLTRSDSLGRSRRFPMISVAVLVVLTATTGALYLRGVGLEDRLSRVTTALIGTSSQVRCQSTGQEMIDAGSELGYVRWGPDGVPEHQTLIKHQPCQDLSAYLDSNHQGPSYDQTVAVHVLSHEAMHMSGITSESQAECAAMQRDAWTARQLGASTEQATALARNYWQQHYPRMPEEYRTTDCRPGGTLDEGLADGPW